MVRVSYAEIIKDQGERALWSVNNVIECIPDGMWDKLYCEMPLWKHVYHMLFSLDTWYINPRKYQMPPFHEKDLNNLDVPTDKRLSRELLRKFFLTVEEKIKEYNNSLTDDILLEKPENCEWTRFALIMGQHRHLHSHMGMIMGFIIAETGLWPRVVGMEGEIPKGEYTKFF
jgi:hypothetical protein